MEKDNEQQGRDSGCNTASCYPKIGDRLYFAYDPRDGKVLAIFTKENKAKDEAAECGCIFGSAIYYG